MCERDASRGEGLSKQGRSYWMVTGGGTSAVAVPLDKILRESNASQL